MCREYCGKIRGTAFLKSICLYTCACQHWYWGAKTTNTLGIVPTGRLSVLTCNHPNPVTKDHKDAWWLSLFLKHSQCWWSSTLYWQKGNVGSVLCSLKSPCITFGISRFDSRRVWCSFHEYTMSQGPLRGIGVCSGRKVYKISLLNSNHWKLDFS